LEFIWPYPLKLIESGLWEKIPWPASAYF